VVQENIELKKQNKDLHKLVNDYMHIKDIHQQLVDKGKQLSKNYDILKQQSDAKDNMIKDLIHQR